MTSFSTTTRCMSTRELEHDFKMLIKFIEVYCHGRHRDEPRMVASAKVCDVQRLMGRDVELCTRCTKLLTHALVKRSLCPMHPKPACKHCPNHCYHPTYRQQIREVMKYSGRKLVLSGRLDLLVHLFF